MSNAPLAVQAFDQASLPQNVGSSNDKTTWLVTNDEKKNYDAIFRAWDTESTGFIDGTVSLEVFGQSGLPQSDLSQIWCASRNPQNVFV